MIQWLNSETSIAAMRDRARELVRSSDGDLSQAAAEKTVAERHGFASWRRLEVFLLQNSPAERHHRENQSPEFLQLACLNYSHNDRPSNWARAREMLQAHPGLAEKDIFHASCVGEVETVRGYLEQDPTLANQTGGYFDWPPLMYACYSRLNLPTRSTLDVARVLLENGADPNAYIMWGGQYKFTALTGVFGEGEGGPVNLPEHEHCESLTRLLLDAGADPNDAQALYNRMFTEGTRCLEMLLEYGLGESHCCNWLVCETDQTLHPNPQQTLRYQLDWAIDNHHTDRAKLLVDHGADLTSNGNQQPVYLRAMRAGQLELAQYLLANGAERVELDSLAQFSCACMRGDEAAARELLAVEPDLMSRLQNEQPGLLHDAAANNRMEAVRTMVNLGADVNRLTYNTPLHEAAWHGHVPMVQWLIKNGADFSIRDHAHGGTPLTWAIYNGQQAVVELLSTQSIDVFDAIACNHLSRLKQIISEQPRQLELTLGEMAGDRVPTETAWLTPLASAVYRQRPEMVRWLLGQGADADVTDRDGKSLLELARIHSTMEIVEVLSEHGSD